MPAIQYAYPREAYHVRSAADAYEPVAVDRYGRPYVRPVSMHGVPVSYRVDGVDALAPPPPQQQQQHYTAQQRALVQAPGWHAPEQQLQQQQQLQHSTTTSTPDRVLIQVTCDNEHFSVVNVTGLDSAPAIRERILQKLGIPTDTGDAVLFRTEIGETDVPTTPPVDDDMLLALCLQFGDNKGSIKFHVVRDERLLQRTAQKSEPQLRTRSAPQALHAGQSAEERRWQPFVTTRDDPYMSAMFPATSNRQVSQFQLISPGSTSTRLQPGMTVQELLGTQTPQGPSHSHASSVSSAPGGRSDTPPDYSRSVPGQPTSPGHGSPAPRLANMSPGSATHATNISPAHTVTASPAHMSTSSPISRVSSSSPAQRPFSGSSPVVNSDVLSPASRASPSLPNWAHSPAQRIPSAFSEGTAYPLFKSNSDGPLAVPPSPGDRSAIPRPLPEPGMSPGPAVPSPMSAPVAPSETLERLMRHFRVSQTEGAFPSFGTFSDDELGGTFAQPLDSATVLSDETVHADGSVTSPAGAGRPAGPRADSISESNWAVRPTAEQLYERIDDYFPRQDLDRPLVDGSGAGEAAAAATAVAANETPSREVDQRALRSIPPALTRGQNHSIRVIAQNRKRMLDRSEREARRKNANKNTSSPDDTQSKTLDRRRSTKLWGGHMVEMTAASSAPQLPSDTNGGKPVFKWVKGDLIGKGTYGRVYLALNATTGEMIAVKQVELPRTASDRESARQRSMIGALKSEIETLKDLDHVNIVSCLGFEETPEYMSIFLEYVPGGSIGSCLRKHGKFEEDTVSSFLNQILQGLAYLHKKGILHRDLKADNILVDYHGTCKISDFGTVRRSADIYSNVENMSLQGSIFWMAPEVMSLSRKGYSAKVDIWSLGCVVLEMLAGRRPWSDEEAVQAMFKIGAERRAPPVPSDCRLSKPAAHFLRNCFEIDPDRRPTATRLLEHVFAWPPPDWCFEQSALWRALSQ
ncbi:mitogen-activated protein kinase kinase kinase [Malassezia cuniculi]|uniref:Mitogen-activated protein kinase kinase kinase n=1 Tax=Malassezia cuniculi TaxID=948313 RepID=A0AAF0ERN3_9BASI|nr:mitogen-activated protein kinase kinase kinase [Malassezia cuniculi]